MSRKKKRVVEKPSLACKVTDWYLFIVFLVFPLVISFGSYGYEYLVDAKAVAWFLMTGVWAVALIVCCIKERVKVRFKWYHWTAVAFLGINLLSALLSDYPMLSLFYIDNSNTNSFIFAFSYVIAFLGVSIFGRLTRCHIWALAISTLICDFIAILQLNGYNPLFLFPNVDSSLNEFKSFGSSFLGTIGNKDILAAYMCFVIPLFIVYACYSKEKTDKLLLILSAISVYILLVADVDSWKVAFIGGLFIIVPVLFKNKYVIGGSVVLFLVALLVVYFWRGESGFIYEASQLMHGHVNPIYGTGRINTWMDGVGYTKGHLLLGNGPGSACWLYVKSQSLNLRTGKITSAYNTHNVYLGYLVECGILGLVAYLVLIFRSFTQFVKQKDKVLLAVGAGVVCYLIQDFFTLGIVISEPFLWLGMALLSREEN